MELPQTLLAKLEAYALAITVAVLAALGWGAYQKGKGIEEERTRGEAKQGAAAQADLKELKDLIVSSKQIAADTRDAVQKNGAARVIERGVIQREIQTNTLYSTTCLPDSGFVQWNRISAGIPLLPVQPAGGQLGGGVSAGTGAPGIRQQGGYLAPVPPRR